MEIAITRSIFDRFARKKNLWYLLKEGDSHVCRLFVWNSYVRKFLINVVIRSRYMGANCLHGICHNWVNFRPICSKKTLWYLLKEGDSHVCRIFVWNFFVLRFLHNVVVRSRYLGGNCLHGNCHNSVNFRPICSKKKPVISPERGGDQRHGRNSGLRIVFLYL